jgi:hypothetical protein
VKHSTVAAHSVPADPSFCFDDGNAGFWPATTNLERERQPYDTAPDDEKVAGQHARLRVKSMNNRERIIMQLSSHRTRK